jgi:hypothetical protein
LLTILLRRHLQTNTVEMEPLALAAIGITSHHGSIADAIAVAIRRFVGVDIALLVVPLEAAVGIVIGRLLK